MKVGQIVKANKAAEVLANAKEFSPCCKSNGCVKPRMRFGLYCIDHNHETQNRVLMKEGGFRAIIRPRKTGKTTEALADANDHSSTRILLVGPRSEETDKTYQESGISCLDHLATDVSTSIEKWLVSWLTTGMHTATLVIDPAPHFYVANKNILMQIESELSTRLRGLRMIVVAQRVQCFPLVMRNAWTRHLPMKKESTKTQQHRHGSLHEEKAPCRQPLATTTNSSSSSKQKTDVLEEGKTNAVASSCTASGSGSVPLRPPSDRELQHIALTGTWLSDHDLAHICLSHARVLTNCANGHGADLMIEMMKDITLLCERMLYRPST